MATVEPAHIVGAHTASPAGYILEPTNLWERIRLWWMSCRGEVRFLDQVDGVPTYLLLRSALNRPL